MPTFLWKLRLKQARSDPTGQAGPINLAAAPPPNSSRVCTPSPQKQPHQTRNVRGPCQGPTHVQEAITPPDPWENLSPPSRGSVPSADLSFSTPSACKWARAISAQAYTTTATGFPGYGRLLPFLDVEKRKPPLLLVGMGVTESITEVSQKTKNRTTIYPAVPLEYICEKNKNTDLKRYMHPSVHSTSIPKS